MSAYLPDGALPKYMLLVGVLAVYNAVQCFVPSMRLTHRIYAKQPAQASPLFARMMGTWTLTSALIRIYAAYNMNNPVAYYLCMWSYVLALGSFGSEVFIFKTAPISSPGVFPVFILAPVSLFWMYTSQSQYLK
ncbi:ergosterol biosynthesis protein [Rhizophlyctis rosea]|uniref:Ergosterol biosynthesis protein n=1 Tax=Rhizophlyctis rosea TaxID=64517 RepID=A0AAD5SJC6_9FUNG|nr:ergosterol biosynthesis protein [Rhizophlyctis rosea]